MISLYNKMKATEVDLTIPLEFLTFDYQTNEQELTQIVRKIHLSRSSKRYTEAKFKRMLE